MRRIALILALACATLVAGGAVLAYGDNGEGEQLGSTPGLGSRWPTTSGIRMPATADSRRPTAA